MTRIPLLARLAVALVAFGPVAAHDTWLICRPPDAKGQDALTFDLTSGMAFPALDHGIARDRVAIARYRVGSKSSDIADIALEAKSLVFRVPEPPSSFLVAWVVLAPRPIELKPAEVAHYLDEIDAPDAIRQTWKSGGAKKRWREVYVKHTKTLVGLPADTDRSWSEPTGMALEIVLESNPLHLKTGDEFPVRALKDGKPASGLAIGLVHEGGTRSVQHRADAEGRTTFRIDRKGRFMLRATDIRRSESADADWRSDFTTLTFEVH